MDEIGGRSDHRMAGRVSVGLASETALPSDGLLQAKRAHAPLAGRLDAIIHREFPPCFFKDQGQPYSAGTSGCFLPPAIVRLSTSFNDWSIPAVDVPAPALQSGRHGRQGAMSKPTQISAWGSG